MHKADMVTVLCNDVHEWNKFREGAKDRIDLSGSKLAGLDLRDADLSNMDLTGADLTDTKLNQSVEMWSTVKGLETIKWDLYHVYIAVCMFKRGRLP